MRTAPMMYASMIPTDSTGGSGGLLAAMLLLSVGTSSGLEVAPAPTLTSHW